MFVPCEAGARRLSSRESSREHSFIFGLFIGAVKGPPLMNTEESPVVPRLSPSLGHRDHVNSVSALLVASDHPDVGF